MRPPDPRCIRFAPPEIQDGTQELEQWRIEYVPQEWRAPKDHVLYRRSGAADLNMRYGEMLDELAKSRCPSEVLHRLAFELIREGEAARRWIDAGAADDPNERRRTEDTQFLGEMRATPRLARRLASQLEREGSALPLLAALRATKIGITSPHEPELPTRKALARLLRAYAAELPKAHTARRGPFLHRTMIGPFDFPGAIDGRAAPRGASRFAPSTAVMYGAVLNARQITSGGGGQAGDLMPETGMPLHPVAAALVKAVTGEDLGGEAVRTRLKDFIKRNPKACWMGWPDREG